MVKKIAIDLSWIKIDESGGSENHTINLLQNINKKNLIFLVSPNILKSNKYLWLKNCKKKILSNYFCINLNRCSDYFFSSFTHNGF